MVVEGQRCTYKMWDACLICMCKKCLWLKSRWDIGQDIDENVKTNERCLIWQNSQSENFVMWYVL